jgi:hypothetical protein
MTAALFGSVGIVFAAYWALADPRHDSIRTEWGYVLWFSAALLLLALALPVLGWLAGGPWVRRISLLAAGGAALGGATNILEDGLGQSWAFWGFVLSAATVVAALLTLTITVAVSTRGRRRSLALVPAGTLVAILGFVEVGGVVMLATWVVAAALALVLPTRSRSLSATPA